MWVCRRCFAERFDAVWSVTFVGGVRMGKTDSPCWCGWRGVKWARVAPERVPRRPVFLLLIDRPKAA